MVSYVKVSFLFFFEEVCFVYQVGDIILYGRTGVCQVTGIASIKSPGENAKLCYMLKPLYQTCTISTPVDNDKVFMRPVISKADAQRLIDGIPRIHAEAYHNRNLPQLKDHYRSVLDSHDCGDILALTLSIYAKKKLAEAHKRKVGAVDERFLREAEDLLFGEFSVALDIPRDEVQSYIARRLKKAASQ